MSFQMSRAVRDYRISVTGSTRRESVERLDFRGVLPDPSRGAARRHSLALCVSCVVAQGTVPSQHLLLSLDAAVFNGRRDPLSLIDRLLVGCYDESLHEGKNLSVSDFDALQINLRWQGLKREQARRGISVPIRDRGLRGALHGSGGHGSFCEVG